MKKFLVFLVSIIVVICLGMTFYYFAKDEEVIRFKTSTIYINAGESISLEDLGFSHTHKKKETKIDFNAGGDAVKEIISYNSALGKYVSTSKGGNTTIVITTNNRKFKRFEIKITVGNGSEETPYQIYTEDDLFAIGTSKFDTTPDNNINEALTSHYILMNDITVTKQHLPIGVTETTADNFEGKLDGNYYTINNLDIAQNTYGSLFGIIGSNAQVVNLNFKDAHISGNFDYAGVLAGAINGYVDRIQIKDCTVSNAKDDSFTGGLAGKIETSINAMDNIATVYRVAIESSNSNYVIGGTTYVGGLAGKVVNANIDGIKSATDVVSMTSTTNYIGGIAGFIELGIYNGYVRESYSLARVTTPNTATSKNGALFGSIVTESGIDEEVALLGLYYDNETCKLKAYKETDLAFVELMNNSGKSNSNLKSNSTYIFYYDDASNPVAWRSSVWKLVDGQYPTLKYLDNAIPSNIDKKPTEPVTPDDPFDPIDPDVTGDTIEIDSKEKLLSIATFETNKTYLVKNDIDLGGANWSAKKLNQAKFVAESPVVISNFNINSSSIYVGFFSSIVNATVNNITFKNATVTIGNASNMQYIGILTGVCNASTISNCNVVDSTIKTLSNNNKTEYVGGLVGGTTIGNSTITNCNVSASIGSDIKNVGGVIGLVGPNTSIENCTFTGNVQAKQYLGGLVAQNNGIIKNSTASADIKISDTQNGKAFVGGFVGVNYNTVDNCKITLDNLTINNSNNLYIINAGGFAGYNGESKLINKCEVSPKSSSSSIVVTNNNGQVFIGGLVAGNSGYIKYSKNGLMNIGAEKSKVYIGGIVGQNDSGSIEACKSLSNVYGDFVGGIAYNIMNNSNISQSAIGYGNTRVTLKGNYVAGIACYMSDGRVEDCLVNTKTYGLSNKSISAGAIIDFPYSSNGRFGVIEHCVISNIFAGGGDKYLSTSSAIFASTRSTGTLKNCVFDMTCDGASTSYEPAYDTSLTGKNKPSASNSSYTKANISNLYLITTYTDCGFSIMTDSSKVWFYTSSGNTLPKLVALESI